MAVASVHNGRGTNARIYLLILVMLTPGRVMLQRAVFL